MSNISSSDIQLVFNRDYHWSDEEEDDDKVEELDSHIDIVAHHRHTRAQTMILYPKRRK